MLAVIGIVLVGAGVALAVNMAGSPAAPQPKLVSAPPLPGVSIASSDGSSTATATTPAAAVETAPIEVEVPNVVGKGVSSAETLIQVAGFTTLTRVADAAVPGVEPETVVSQSPAAGSRLQPGARVTITYQPRGPVAATGKQFVVVIDPGHQAKADLTLEPIGPGSKTMKEKVRGGATGVSTKIPEYKQALAISLKLRDKLQAAGIKVVMIRTTNDVNISNARRAQIGNQAAADLVVRVHLDSSVNSSVTGITTLFPSGNAWCKPIEPLSRTAAEFVESAVTKATGAHSRGITGRSDMTGFNWSTRPTIIVESGFMSNPAEDRRCANPQYQDKIAGGIATGVLAFLRR